MHSFVKAREVNVMLIEMSICQIYDAPYYYRDYLYKTHLKEFKNINTKGNIELPNRRERDV
ncbi:hypothetical protein Goshw_007842, partial [Gossypium schwendimanii]|nr:hypothetical protein [Gossypium schwendimanii]